MFREEQLKALLQGRRILIAGYGREGKSTHALLQQLLPDQPCTIAANDAEIVAALQQQHYDLVVKSPGIPTFRFEDLCTPETITSQTDLFLQVYGDITVAVTGTKGKSTTTHLLYSLLSSTNPNTIMAGNMGIPLFDILPLLGEQCRVVAEFSCHQLENIHRAPHLAVLLNLYQEHLDHYHNYEEYKLAKLNIALQQQPGDRVYYCTENAELSAMVESYRKDIRSEITPYSLQQYEQVRQYKTTLVGDHNLSNIVVAQLVARYCGISDETFAATLAQFRGLEHRLELIGTHCGITFYNDSISTIPAATEAAVTALGNVDSLILGGFDRGIDYTGLARFLATSNISHFLFTGKAGRRIYQELSVLHPIEHYLVSDDYAAIVDYCYKHTARGKVCLLSPAAASYDAFKNFEERGKVFRQLVETKAKEI